MSKVAIVRISDGQIVLNCITRADAEEHYDLTGLQLVDLAGSALDAAAKGFPLEFIDGAVTPSLDAARARARDLVNERAEHIRSLYLTQGSGQAMTYLRKEDEARRFDPGGDPSDYPFLSAEAASTGASLADTASLVLGQAEAWATLGAAIEGHRRGLIVAIEAAQNIETLDQLDVSAGWPGQAETQS